MSSGFRAWKATEFECPKPRIFPKGQYVYFESDEAFSSITRDVNRLLATRVEPLHSTIVGHFWKG